MAQSLYEKYGGFSTVSRIVLDFYEKVLDSDEIGHHFEDVDMPRLVDHQTKFISTLLGGPASYTDERLSQLHRHLNITPEEFDAMTALLGETLLEHGFSEADADTVMASIRSRRGAIIS